MRASSVQAIPTLIAVLTGSIDAFANIAAVHPCGNTAVAVGGFFSTSNS